MTDASIITGQFEPQLRHQDKTLKAPKPQPLGAPVLIYDCATPLGGETLLSLLMKRMMQEHQS